MLRLGSAMGGAAMGYGHAQDEVAECVAGLQVLPTGDVVSQAAAAEAEAEAAAAAAAAAAEAEAAEAEAVRLTEVAQVAAMGAVIWAATAAMMVSAHETDPRSEKAGVGMGLAAGPLVPCSLPAGSRSMPRVALPRSEKTEVWSQLAPEAGSTTAAAESLPKVAPAAVVASTAMGRAAEAAMAEARVGTTAVAIEVGWQAASGVAVATEVAWPVAGVAACEEEEQRVATWVAVVVERDAGSQGSNRGDGAAGRRPLDLARCTRKDEPAPPKRLEEARPRIRRASACSPGDQTDVQRSKPRRSS